MSDNTKAVAKDQTTAVGQQAGGQPVGQRPGEYVRPLVDIYEDEAGITLIADMPGVSKERLNLQVDKDTLLIEGEAVLDTPGDLKALYAEMRNPHFQRSFALSSELDTDAIQAAFKDGLLTVRLLKKAMHQPRKITVASA